MTQLCTGIILKKDFSKNFQIFLLDSQLGKIIVTPNTDNLCVGAIIQYQRAQKRNAIFSIDTIALPIALAKDDILFLHHILELIRFF